MLLHQTGNYVREKRRKQNPFDILLSEQDDRRILEVFPVSFDVPIDRKESIHQAT